MTWFLGALVFFGVVFIFGFLPDMIKVLWEEFWIWVDERKERQ